MRRHTPALIAAVPLVFTAIAVTGCSSSPSTGLIPRATFFGNPQRAAPMVSPDGRHLAYLAPNNDVLNIWVRTIGGDDDRPVTQSRVRPVRNYQWAENSSQIIYPQDEDGSENFHLYCVDIETGEQLDLTPHANIQAQFIAQDRSQPDHILAAINNRDPSMHDVWRINTRTGEGELVYENRDGYISFVADHDLVVRVATRMTSSGGTVADARDSNRPDGDWYELARWTPEDSLSSQPLQFDRSGENLYLLDSRAADTGQLFVYRVTAPERSYYIDLATDTRADPSEVIFDPATGKPQVISFEYARKNWHVIDFPLRSEWAMLTGFRDADMSILSRSRDDQLWTISYLNDDGPVEYFLYDRNDRQIQRLFSNRPELESLRLAKMETALIKSRDGLELVSYLTRAVGRSGPGPLVLLVHGGPWGRDSWGYNAIHQWLANRGYSVLSVNFRGSTGLGKRFLNAGNHEWAARMHTDLLDAVDWAIARRIADPSRIAIMGGSYGGYATLVGLTFTPERFACGVDIVGPSHVRTLLESIPPYWQPIMEMFEHRVGSLDDPEYLDSISPLTRVDQIRKPLLIGQGANDPRVKQSESEQIVSAMQQRGLPVTYVLFPDEGHGFARPENSMAFFAITEKFLAEHLGGRYEEIGDDVANSSAIIKAGGELLPDAGNAVTPPADVDDVMD